MRAVLAALALAGLAGCTWLDLDKVSEEDLRPTLFQRPDDPQEAIGAREHPLVVAKYGGEYRNEAAERMLAVIVGRLIAVSDDPLRVYKVTILDSAKINAFALPGGFLYLTRGLLALANDSAEIAAVIAHEMAHVSANHAILRQEKLAGSDVGEDVVHEVLGDSVAAQVALAANRIKLADFSREQELQADAIGIRMVGDAGFDPYAAGRFLEAMRLYQAYVSGGTGEDDDFAFMSSHPTTPRRVELARAHARKFGSQGVGEAGRDRYLDGIEGLAWGDSPDDGFVRGQTYAHAGLGIAFRAPEGARIDNQSRAVVITGPADAATRFDTAAIAANQSLMDYFRTGWVNGLDPATIAAYPAPPGFEGARADATAEGWRFRIVLMRQGTEVFRFITAVPAVSAGSAVAVSEPLVSSFHRLSRSELASLRPLAVRTVVVKPGDTAESLAATMRGTTGDPVRLFRVLNNVAEAAPLPEGQRVKIVAEGTAER